MYYLLLYRVWNFFLLLCRWARLVRPASIYQFSQMHPEKPGAPLKLLWNHYFKRYVVLLVYQLAETHGRGEGAVPKGIKRLCASCMQNVDRVSFLINVNSCPPGYVLLRSFTHPHLYHCQCELENEGIVNCDGLSIKIKVNMFIR